MPHADPEARRVYHRDWKRRNRGRYRWMDKTYDAARHANQRAAKYGAPGAITPEDVRELLQPSARCVYCGTHERLTVDHAIPLNEGGPNAPHNLQAACHSCNASKYRQDRPWRWSRDHDACVGCGTSEGRHSARGYCNRCYLRHKNEEVLREGR